MKHASAKYAKYAKYTKGNQKQFFVYFAGKLSLRIEQIPKLSEKQS